MKKIVFALIISAAFSTANAQKEQYIYGAVGSGIHNINYGLGEKGNKTPGIGIGVKAGWQCFFNEHLGYGVGLSFNTQKTVSKLDFTQKTDNLSDSENGLGYTGTTVFHGLEETDRQKVLDLPVSFYYQAQLSERWRFLAGISIFYTAVLSQKYSTDDGHLSTGKYFEAYHLDYSGINAEEHGIVSLNNFSGDTKLKKSVFGTGIDLQLCYALGEAKRLELVFGLYGAYRFADQKDAVTTDVFDNYALEYVGITQSKVSDKVSSSNFGALVGVRFRIDRKDNVIAPKL